MSKLFIFQTLTKETMNVSMLIITKKPANYRELIKQ